MRCCWCSTPPSARTRCRRSRLFGKTAGVTGLVMTKLDGTARGGILVALAEKFGLPVHFIGVGEGIDDLQPFTARDFARVHLVGLEASRMAAKAKQLNPGAQARARYRAADAVLHRQSSGSASSPRPALSWWRCSSRLRVSYVLTRHIPVMPMVTAVVVLVFGGLTLILHDELFIKLKPTIIYVLFGGALLGGLLFGKPLLGMVFDSVFNLTDEGWRKLTMRWIWFFFALAVLNEIVWRTQTTDFWVNFKLFGVLPLTLVFGALQYPLMMKYDAARS